MDTTVKTNAVRPGQSDEKQNAYQVYMTAFRRAQSESSPQNETAALEAYYEYLRICGLYIEGEEGLVHFSTERYQ